MATNRQIDRVFNKNDPYHFYNNEIKVLLKDFFKNKYNDKLNCLDFGCGEKPFNAIFLEMGLKKIVSCDIEQNSKSDIDIIIDPKIPYLPFTDEKFDFIFAFDVFEHVNNLENTIDELKRTLKPGGQIICTMPFLYRVHEAPNDYRRFTFNGLKQFFSKYDFEVLNFKPLGNVFDVSHTILNEGIFSNNLITKILKRILIYQLKFTRLMVPSKSFSINETYFGCFFSLKRNL